MKKYLLFIAIAFLIRCSTTQNVAVSEENKATVYVNFTVDSAGNVSNASVFKVDCLNCADSSIEKMKKEALEEINKMPKWKPAHDVNGQPVSISYNVPIIFNKLKY